MIKVAIVVTFPPRFISPDSLISIYISNNWSGKNAHSCGNVIILLKNGNAHNTINGTIIAVVVECVIADTSIANKEAKSLIARLNNNEDSKIN